VEYRLMQFNEIYKNRKEEAQQLAQEGISSSG